MTDIAETLERQVWIDGDATSLQDDVRVAYATGWISGRLELLEGSHQLHRVLTDALFGDWERV